MGKPSWSHVQLPLPEHIGQLEGTWGSETSQYPQEEKTTVIPRVVASESGCRLNRFHVIPGRGCGGGVVGSSGRFWRIRGEGEKKGGWRRAVEGGAGEGGSPVR